MPRKTGPNLTLQTDVHGSAPKMTSVAVAVPTPSNAQMGRHTPKVGSLEYSMHPVTPSKGAPVKAFFGVDDNSKGKKILSRFAPPPPSGKDTNSNFDFTELKDLVYIASGEFANVYSGNWGSRRVAVKILKEEYLNDDRARGDIEFEMKVMSVFDSSKFLVEMYGSGICEGRPFIVMEELPNGTLEKNFPNYTRNLQKVDILLMIAMALKHMHEVCLPHYIVMHRDLKPKNIAINQEGVPKLLDFGLSRVVETRPELLSPDFPQVNDTQSESTGSITGSETTMSIQSSSNDGHKNIDDLVFEMTGETGSLRYMAPEVAKNAKYNHKADCYSWAVLAWQIMTKRTPYSTMGVQDYHTQVVGKGFRMAVPAQWPPGLGDLVKEAWDPDIRKRPNFSAIVARLEEIKAALEVDVGTNGGCCTVS
mmetsp:Transcript_5892/g.12222  ORF Transcript_5892/g.12222 Transcript_5892/m.12222 type:complete len:421 (-) Transcript_5892:236-1498(-)